MTKTKLQGWLNERRLTQGQLAEQMGTSREEVCRVANGKPPTAGFLLKFWGATDIDTIMRVFDEELPA